MAESIKNYILGKSLQLFLGHSKGAGGNPNEEQITFGLSLVVDKIKTKTSINVFFLLYITSLWSFLQDKPLSSSFNSTFVSQVISIVTTMCSRQEVKKHPMIKMLFKSSFRFLLIILAWMCRKLVMNRIFFLNYLMSGCKLMMDYERLDDTNFVCLYF
ncbi:hypothetical protein PPACK8108_LOCUS16249 [Phakopsora pachyrhizi]|uniref:Uncharacterized protein n=1 Tax=Phakopsora pachyrhizi TaxID=170000 RepID=A0AAV0BA47_PHAPC|nr:hypothetical protein PPACK8108_LOCUS16249 [Phakopsora pachyrhizi]